MAIKIQGGRQHKSSATNKPGNGQQLFSLHFKVKIPDTATPSACNGLLLVAREGFCSFAVELAGAGSAAGYVKLKSFAKDAAGGSHTLNQDLSVGATHTYAFTHNGPSSRQIASIDAVDTRISSFTGALESNAAKGFLIGGLDLNPGAGCQVILEDVYCWDGYELTTADKQALRDGANPATIGSGTRYRWTLAIPGGKSAGDAVVVGDAGVNEAGGTTALNLTAFSTGTNGGSSVYADPLVWTPPATIGSGYASTSGRLITLLPATVGTGAATQPTGLVTYPTLKVNGVSVGALRNAWVSSYHNCLMFATPAGVTIGPNDTLSLDAPGNGWLNTAAGACQPLSNFALGNRVGRSSFGTDTLARTLKQGLNFSGKGWWNGGSATYNLMKNWALGCAPFSGTVTADANGKPTKFQHPSESSTFYSIPNSNGIDGTSHEAPTGHFVVCWDDDNISDPTDFAIATDVNGTVSEVTSVRNFGASGVGKARVFLVAHAPGSTTGFLQLKVTCSNATGNPRFSNLVIYGPKDFTFTPSVPVTVDRSDPYAMSRIAIDRLGTNVGALRWMDTITDWGGTSNAVEAGDSLKLTDWQWNSVFRAFRTIGHTQARPLDRTASPYIYSPVWGSNYPCTLAADIDASQTTVTISDAATAPVFAGQRLHFNAEIMGVTAVSGTSVTVRRGIEGTTAASHSAGAYANGVGKRFPTPTGQQLCAGNGIFAEFVTSAPHGIQTGQRIQFQPTWPTMAFGGYSLNLGSTGTSALIWVTGANSYVIAINPGVSSSLNLTSTYALTPTSAKALFQINHTGYPIEVPAKVCGQLGCDLWVNVPTSFTDDAVDDWARRIRDNYPSGTGKVRIELGNENWNWGFGQSRQLRALSQGFGLGNGPYEATALRTNEIVQRFKAIFNEGGRARGGEIDLTFNFISKDTGEASTCLAFCRSQSPPINVGTVSQAPYITWLESPSSEPSTLAAAAAYDPDQIADLYIHHLWYNVGPYSWPKRWQALKAVIDAHNTASGDSAILAFYEGGHETLLPGSITNWNEKSRDVFYHPNWYVNEQDLYALAQINGVKRVCWFCYGYTWFNNKYHWAFWKAPHQTSGRGDGSDGLFDNRLCMATPGFPGSKGATTNQDAHTVSPRGKAFKDWYAGATAAGLAVSPGEMHASDTTDVVWIGTETHYLTVAPTFTPTGVPNVDAGDITVISDTEAHATVTTGADTGILTWTDSTTGATATQTVLPAAGGNETLSVSPGTLVASSSTEVTWTGTDTHWIADTPAFEHAGVDNVSLGSITYDSDTSAHATVTTGADTGTLTWTDPSTGKTATQTIVPAPVPPPVDIEGVGIILLEDGSHTLIETGDNLLLEGIGVATIIPSLTAIPSVIAPGTTVTVTVEGTGVDWINYPPDVTITSPPGTTTSEITVIDSDTFTITITAGRSPGDVIITEETYGLSVVVAIVRGSHPPFTPTRVKFPRAPIPRTPRTRSF